VKRNKGPAFAAAVVLTTLLIGIAGTTWGLVRAREQSRAAEEQRDSAKAERTRAEEATIEADQERRHAEVLTNQKAAELARTASLLYDMQFRDADHLFRSFDFGRCRAVLAGCRQDLRGPEYGYLVKQLENRVRMLPGQVNCLALSGDGKRLCIASGDIIKVSDLEMGQERNGMRLGRKH
jgi:hypothetical protein